MFTDLERRRRRKGKKKKKRKIKKKRRRKRSKKVTVMVTEEDLKRYEKQETRALQLEDQNVKDTFSLPLRRQGISKGGIKQSEEVLGKV